jgi:hypothetical protein
MTVVFDREIGENVDTKTGEVSPVTRRERRQGEAHPIRERKPLKWSWKIAFWVLLAILVLSHMGNAQKAPSVPLSAFPPCETEDSQNCYWDAQTRGNGSGDSFIDIGGYRYLVK